MTDFDATLKVATDRRASPRERELAANEFDALLTAQAPSSLEIIEELTPQDEKSRLPIRIGRRYFHSWKDTEKLYAEVTDWDHFSLDNCPADTAPPVTQAHFEEVFADVIKSHGATLRLHPLYKRWTVFMRSPTHTNESAYQATIMIAESDGVWGEVPTDLKNSVDSRLHPLIAKMGMGSYKVPTKHDFEVLRYQWADIQAQGGARAVAKRKRTEELKDSSKMQSLIEDFIDDFVSHNGALLEQEINRKHGSMQGLPFVPQTSLEQFEKENPSYEYADALDPETGKKLGYKYRRKLLPWERGEVLAPETLRFIAMQAAQGKWEREYELATADKKELLRMGEPLINDDERVKRVNAWANAMETKRELGILPEERLEIFHASKDAADGAIEASTSVLEELMAQYGRESKGGN